MDRIRSFWSELTEQSTLYKVAWVLFFKATLSAFVTFCILFLHLVNYSYVRRISHKFDGIYGTLAVLFVIFLLVNCLAALCGWFARNPFARIYQYSFWGFLLLALAANITYAASSDVHEAIEIDLSEAMKHYAMEMYGRDVAWSGIEFIFVSMLERGCCRFFERIQENTDNYLRYVTVLFWQETSYWGLKQAHDTGAVGDAQIIVAAVPPGCCTVGDCRMHYSGRLRRWVFLENQKSNVSTVLCNSAMISTLAAHPTIAALATFFIVWLCADFVMATAVSILHSKETMLLLHERDADELTSYSVETIHDFSPAPSPCPSPQPRKPSTGVAVIPSLSHLTKKSDIDFIMTHTERRRRLGLEPLLRQGTPEPTPHRKGSKGSDTSKEKRKRKPSWPWKRKESWDRKKSAEG